MDIDDTGVCELPELVRVVVLLGCHHQSGLGGVPAQHLTVQLGLEPELLLRLLARLPRHQAALGVPAVRAAGRALHRGHLVRPRRQPGRVAVALHLVQCRGEVCQPALLVPGVLLHVPGGGRGAGRLGVAGKLALRVSFRPGRQVAVQVLNHCIELHFE